MLYLSLYSGIGGLDLALEALGHTPEARVEVDPWCRSVLSAREADGSLKPAPQPTFGDVRSEEFLGYLIGLAARGTERAEDRMRMLGGDPNPFPLLLAAGVPCQIASTAGKRLGSKDPRNLWPETLDIVDKVKPEVVFFENVRGLLTLEQGKFFTAILRSLQSARYHTAWMLVRASEAGAPHLRDRVFVMGVREGSQKLVSRLHKLPGDARALVREHLWPAPRTPSMFQYLHEEPRLSTVSDQRPKRLRALGNMVVPQQAVLAYTMLASVCDVAPPTSRGDASHYELKHADFGAFMDGSYYAWPRDRLDRVDTQRVDEECEFPSFVRASKTRWFWLDLPMSPREAQVAKQDPFPSDPSQPWPTADASASNVGEARETWEARRRMLKEAHKARKNGVGNGAGTPLGIAVQPWPTATATDSKGSGAAGYSTENRHAGLTLTDAAVRGFTSSTEKVMPADTAQPWATALASDAKMPGPNGDSKREGGEHLVEQTRQSPWGTPTARDAKDGGALSDEAPTTPENGYVGRQVLAEKSLRASKGALNPNWVEQLMGLPVGWTDPTKSLPWYSGAVCADSDAGKEEE